MSVVDGPEGGIIIVCDICHNPMKQSKNDSELYLCYNCNERIMKSQLKVEQIIVPKKESHKLNYRDDFFESGVTADIIAEGDTPISSFELMKEVNYSQYDSREIQKEQEKIKIKDMFSKLLPEGTKIKVEFAH